jgi:hypothetical protein
MSSCIEEEVGRRKRRAQAGRVLITGFRVGDFIQPINVRKGAMGRAHRLFSQLLIEFPTRVLGTFMNTQVLR